MQTLYQFGKDATLRLIGDYLELLEATRGLDDVGPSHFEKREWRLFLLGGKGVQAHEMPETAQAAHALHSGRRAIDHDIQSAVAGPLYIEMQAHALSLARRAAVLSDGFTTLEADVLHDEPELLPIYMHAAGVFSMSVLRKAVGTISDTGMSPRAAARAVDFLLPRLTGDVDPKRLVERLGSTLEGQARDLLGRYLLEAVVEAAFRRHGVAFQRETEYKALAGVVYDHRADFVVPDATAPKLFVEVRRSSARHSSLYAKDKMFSAINWKGRHSDLIGVLVIDGEWSQHSKLALAHVFDYVLPVSAADELARVAQAYLAGDTSKLLRTITFEISARNGGELPRRPDAPLADSVPDP
ncbi:hypothetical protein [Conexibacter arvalis]|uniref:Uncharacterized protein n=1 Tax=Conexibacter arvalis TaxID=912552 RepID=A0A840IBC1_9ACTN|nr:hypothetical protein [Conexibacter arvalis]MBB4661645.1 hypothetical protein [Conexibacter arvalis]